MIELGLIGYPLGHSLSPEIHEAALKSCDLQGDYALFPVPPDDLDALKELLVRVRNGEIIGLNVTIPHKQNVIPLLDELSPSVDAIGAVNTISLHDGKLTGDNTDAPGFLADLQKLFTMETWKHQDTKTVLVLGAGGSARAVVYALAHDCWTVTIAARRLEQAQEFINHFPNNTSRITSIEYRSPVFNSLLSTLSLVVNTTPVGMSPNADASPWPVNLPFPPNAAIYDLIYNPRETKLVKDACNVGLSATTGLGMLIEQAALSFEIWTGCNVPREPLFAAVEEL